mgnify:CR=1 FL=1
MKPPKGFFFIETFDSRVMLNAACIAIAEEVSPGLCRIGAGPEVIEAYMTLEQLIEKIKEAQA